ncbi:MAG: hypothetical protein AAB648_01630 [Patescibacteria group bacterium]
MTSFSNELILNHFSKFFNHFLIEKFTALGQILCSFKFMKRKDPLFALATRRVVAGAASAYAATAYKLLRTAIVTACKGHAEQNKKALICGRLIQIQ